MASTYSQDNVETGVGSFVSSCIDCPVRYYKRSIRQSVRQLVSQPASQSDSQSGTQHSVSQSPVQYQSVELEVSLGMLRGVQQLLLPIKNVSSLSHGQENKTSKCVSFTVSMTCEQHLCELLVAWVQEDDPAPVLLAECTSLSQSGMHTYLFCILPHCFLRKRETQSRIPAIARMM